MTKQMGARTADARLLAMATRLFRDFEELPVRTVFQAIRAARHELRERQQGPPTAEDIEALARPQLEDAVAPPDPPNPPGGLNARISGRSACGWACARGPRRC